MAQYKALLTFDGIKEKKRFLKGDIFEISTKKRANELLKIGYIEEIAEDPKEVVPDEK